MNISTLFRLVMSVATLLPVRLFASPQLPDYIIYGTDTVATYNLLVEQYWQAHEKAPTDKLFGLSFRGEDVSLNCWRGYQAIYRIDGDSLFLVHMIHCGERTAATIDVTASAKKMKEVFRDKVVKGKVYIDWFSGDVSFPRNHTIIRWDGVFYAIFEKETVISIAAGKVLHIEDVENYEDDRKAIDRRDKSRVADILFKQLKKVKWKSVDAADCSEAYLVTIGKDGMVTKVAMLEYQNPDTIDKYWDREEYNYCIRTIYQALYKLKFDIIKDKGKPIAENIYLEIWFDKKKGRMENWTH